jgi:hypothetical protein
MGENERECDFFIIVSLKGRVGGVGHWGEKGLMVGTAIISQQQPAERAAAVAQKSRHCRVPGLTAELLPSRASLPPWASSPGAPEPPTWAYHPGPPARTPSSSLACAYISAAGGAAASAGGLVRLDSARIRLGSRIGSLDAFAQGSSERLSCAHVDLTQRARPREGPWGRYHGERRAPLNDQLSIFSNNFIIFFKHYNFITMNCIVIK